MRQKTRISTEKLPLKLLTKIRCGLQHVGKSNHDTGLPPTLNISLNRISITKILILVSQDYIDFLTFCIL